MPDDSAARRPRPAASFFLSLLENGIDLGCVKTLMWKTGPARLLMDDRLPVRIKRVPVEGQR